MGKVNFNDDFKRDAVAQITEQVLLINEGIRGARSTRFAERSGVVGW